MKFKNDLKKMFGFALDTEIVEQTSEYAEHANYDRFRIFDGKNGYVVVIVDEFGNHIVSLPEMPFNMAVDIMTGSKSGDELYNQINSLL